MKYNLTPIYDVLDDSVPSASEWKEKFHLYFSNPHYDSNTLDMYYNFLLSELPLVNRILKCGYLVDEYSGLFSIDVPDIKYCHSFNMANFIRRNHGYFNKKKIATISSDYGIMNVQILQCGLDLVFSSMPFEHWIGMVLVNIGNQCKPYLPGVGEFDVLFVANSFNSDGSAFVNWNFMMNAHLDGKEVYYTTQSSKELRKHFVPEKIQQVEDPNSIYDAVDYANIDMGYMNKIYRIV